MPTFTKNAIRETFIELLKKKSIDKITVKDIVEECGINRNTFYYYYADIYELVEDVIITEKDKVLKEVGEGTNFYDEYMRSADLVINFRSAILHLYHSKSRDTVVEYLQAVVNNFVEKFVRKAANEYDLCDSDIRYITLFYSYSIVGSTIEWIKGGMQDVQDQFIKDISASFDATIEDMIKERMNKK